MRTFLESFNPMPARSFFRSPALPILTFVLFLAACGGSSNGPPPPPSGPFSNASLSGQYAFSISGQNTTTGGFTGVIGSISADGNGHITTGLADVLDLSQNLSSSLITYSGGTYDIQANGRGVMTLNITSGGTLQLSFTLKSSQQGYLIETDGLATSAGTLYQQTPSAFSAASVNGNYLFDLSGVSFAGSPPSLISTVGEFAGDGNGNITGGVMDVNDGAFTPSGPLAVTPATYQMDTDGNGTNFGRGTATINDKTYAFYIVDNTRIKFLEEDATGGSEGDAVLQTGTIPTQNSNLNGGFVFLTAGSLTTGHVGPIDRIGRMSTDGAGTISSVAFDQNSNGNNAHISEGSSLSAATYAMDTNYPGSGRGTFTFQSSSVGLATYVFYFYSSTRAVIQDVTPGIVADGTMLSQVAGPFTTSAVTGNFVFNWNGLQLINPSAYVEHFVGQAAQSTASNNNLTGAADFTELGLTTSNAGINLDAGISATLTINGDGTQDNPLKVAVGGASPFTINFKAYIADSTDILVSCHDSDRTTSGLQVMQTQ
jgi:hypothetical protein